MEYFYGVFTFIMEHMRMMYKWILLKWMCRSELYWDVEQNLGWSRVYRLVQTTPTSLTILVKKIAIRKARLFATRTKTYKWSLCRNWKLPNNFLLEKYLMTFMTNTNSHKKKQTPGSYATWDWNIYPDCTINLSNITCIVINIPIPWWAHHLSKTFLSHGDSRDSQ